ncbi:MAG: GNAT family N-acetyltransferase [Methyloceanibacter sp.]
MPREIAIARAVPGDAAIMQAIHASCFTRGWDITAMTRFLSAPDTAYLLGTLLDGANSTPGGMLIARRAADESELLTLAVAPVCRRAGLGRALLVNAIDLLGSAGARQLFLEVDEGNQAAVALYASLGAVRVGKRPSYYDDGADAAIFSLALSQ